MRLVGYTAAGGTLGDVATVVVDGGMKIGHMSFSVVDMTVQVGGFPITMTRTYDSRDTIRKKTGGDFGVGWSLSIAGAKVQKSGVLARGWRTRKAGLGGVDVVPDRSHLVTVTTADGRTYSFAPKLIDKFTDGTYKIATVAYEAVGTTPPGATLDAVNAGSPKVQLEETFDAYNSVVLVPDEFLLNGDGPREYDPTEFLLTLRNGTTMRLYSSDSPNFGSGASRGSGLYEIADRNGNRLTFDAGGVHSFSAAGYAAGKQQAGIVITRGGGGAANYITAIEDPKHKRIVYNQSDGGDLTSVTNRVGDTTRFTYDGRHFVTGIIDPRGVQPIRNLYDAAGRLVQTIDARGKSVTFDHNMAAGLETTTDRMGYIMRMGYDSYGNVTHVEKPITVYVNGVAQTTGATIVSDTAYSTDPTNYDQPVTMTVHPTGNAADDRVSSMAYDGNGSLIESTDALGNKSHYTYNPYGQPLSVTDPLDRVMVTNTYDLYGNLQSSSDALGNTTSTVSNDQGLPVAVTNALKQTTMMRYDFDTGRVQDMRDALGHGTGFVYDGNGSKTATVTNRTKADGTSERLISQTVYDDEDRVIQTVAPDGSTSRTVYNEIGKVAASSDSFGRVTSHLYDELGRQIQTTQSDGVATISSYDDNGRKYANASQNIREDGSIGWLTTKTLYDEAGRSYGSETWDGLPGGNGSIRLSQSFTNIDLADETTSNQDARGNTLMGLRYNANGQVTSMSDARNNQATDTWDKAGQQTGLTDSLNHTFTTAYDDDGRVKSMTSPVGTTTTRYDAVGNHVINTDPSGRATINEYDGLNRLKAVTYTGVLVTDPAIFRTTYSYDELGNKTGQTDANGHTTHFEFDAMGRMTARILPLGQRETMTYRVDGKIATRSDFNGITTIYAYDDDLGSTIPLNKRAGRLLSKSCVGGTVTATDAMGHVSLQQVPPTNIINTYYSDGTLASCTRTVNGVSTASQYTHDIRGRLIKVVGPVGTLAYTYDDESNKTSMSKISDLNGTPVWTVGYGYDENHRLKTVTHPDGKLTTYTYDAVGNRATFVRPNGVVTNYRYDGANRLIAVNNSVGSSFSYTLDAAGRRLSVTDSARGTTNYTYDTFGRLVQEDGFVGNINYQYDNVGNRTTMTKKGVVTTYTYDDNDRLSTEVSPTSWLRTQSSRFFTSSIVRVESKAYGATLDLKRSALRGKANEA